MNEPPVFRIRIAFSKCQSLRYTGSLDMHRIWERSFRRAQLPLAYSQGFHPQPRINQALPLPLGMTSQNDLAEFWLEKEMDLLEVAKALQPAVPPGLDIHSIETVDLRSPSLPLQVISAEYKVQILVTIPDSQLSQSIAELLARPEIIREKRGKQYDLRPLVEVLRLQNGDNGQTILIMQLSAREGATGRPEEVLTALDLDPFMARIERSRLILSS